MKKVITILVALLIVAPAAMAEVQITATQVDDTNEVEIGYVCTAGEAVRSFSMDLTVDGEAVITDITDFFTGECTSEAQGYGIFMSNITIDGTGAVTDYGTPVSAQDKLPSDTQAGLGTNGITVGMASLYDASVTPAIAPAASGKLFSIFVDQSCTLTINPNVSRGGIVLEDGTSSEDDPGVANNMPVTATVTIPEPPQGCYGDVDENQQVDFTDVLTIVGWINNYGTGRIKSIPSTDTEHYVLMADVDNNAQIDFTDVLTVVGWINNYGTGRIKSIVCPHSYGPNN